MSSIVMFCGSDFFLVLSAATGQKWADTNVDELFGSLESKHQLFKENDTHWNKSTLQRLHFKHLQPISHRFLRSARESWCLSIRRLLGTTEGLARHLSMHWDCQQNHFQCSAYDLAYDQQIASVKQKEPDLNNTSWKYDVLQPRRNSGRGTQGHAEGHSKPTAVGVSYILMLTSVWRVSCLNPDRFFAKPARCTWWT